MLEGVLGGDAFRGSLPRHDTGLATDIADDGDIGPELTGTGLHGRIGSEIAPNGVRFLPSLGQFDASRFIDQLAVDVEDNAGRAEFGIATLEAVHDGLGLFA